MTLNRQRLVQAAAITLITTMAGFAFAVETEIQREAKILRELGVTQLLYDDELESATRLTVAEVAPNSVAAAEGLNAASSILKVDGQTWNSLAEAKEVLKSASSDHILNIEIDGGTRFTLISNELAAGILKELGLEIQESSAARFGVKVKSATGVASQLGIRADDHFIAIDGKPYNAPDVFTNVLHKTINAKGSAVLLIEPSSGGIADRFEKVIPPMAPVSDPGPALLRGVQSAKTGDHVPYPSFLGTGTQPKLDTDRSVAVSHEVVTARVELYYFRDAHRVAQIINRNVESFNAAAISQFERAAATARDTTTAATLRRRDLEAEARQVAAELRQNENRLAQLVGELREQLRKQAETRQLTTEIDLLEKKKAATTDPARQQQLQDEIDAKTVEKQRVESEIGQNAEAVALVKNTIKDLVAQIDQQRREVAKKQAAVDKAEFQEQAAAKDQFRREVSAAKVDPDTYVPGDMASIDPVTQVSISVIGEGVLHLRGPRQGVIKVRQMIDEIDHPVGQVKIGVLTIQLNGENGSRMENTVQRVEGQVSRSRFLAYVSGQLFARAVVEVATHVATGLHSSVQPCEPKFAQKTQLCATDEQRARWKRYLNDFFGADFIDELLDVDPETSVLDPFNKLLSFSSADTVTLAEALIMTALAKADVRTEILNRFDMYLMSELPIKESQWMVTNSIHRRYDPRWWGDAKWGRNAVEKDALRKYRFEAVRTYFVRTFDHPELANDRLNPLQREVVKLVQGISLEQGLRGQRDALILKRNLLEAAKQDRSPAAVAKAPLLNGVEQSFLNSQVDILEERHMIAEESLRGRKAAIDKLIKSVMVAIEDDVSAQYYEPALQRIRKAAGEWDVELSDIERTTILTNNRAFGKVTPQATFEFDLPKRDILIAEALQAAYALQKDLGPLLADPNFGTLAKMFAGQSITGSTVDGTIKNVLPGLSTATDQQNMLYADSNVRPKFGTELEKLIPDPAIYKFETGTGFEIRPVIQPDGQSVVFDFNYMYTTDLLEPVRPDEKHLGRVKRHFVNTEVQLGTLEWREISRYEVALKAARNSRGVPLLEDVPVAGVLFRPLPQAEKSLQKNIIIGQAVVYPTIQDLLGLRPAEVCHQGIGKIIHAGVNELELSQRLHQGINDKMNLLLSKKLPRGDVPACPPQWTGPSAPVLRDPTTEELTYPMVPAPAPAESKQNEPPPATEPALVPAPESVSPPAVEPIPQPKPTSAPENTVESQPEPAPVPVPEFDPRPQPESAPANETEPRPFDAEPEAVPVPVPPAEDEPETSSRPIPQIRKISVPNPTRNTSRSTPTPPDSSTPEFVEPAEALNAPLLIEPVAGASELPPAEPSNSPAEPKKAPDCIDAAKPKPAYVYPVPANQVQVNPDGSVRIRLAAPRQRNTSKLDRNAELYLRQTFGPRQPPIPSDNGSAKQ